MSAWKEIFSDQDARRLAAVLLLVLGLLLVQAWLWGKVFDAAANFRDRQTQQKQLANVERLIETIRVVDSAEATLLDQATVAFPLSEAAPLVVERLESLAEAQGLSLEVTSIIEQSARTAKKRELTPFDVSIVAAGPPHSLLAFLDSVEHMQEFTEVQTWKLETLPGQTSAGKLYTVVVTVRLFLQPSP